MQRVAEHLIQQGIDHFTHDGKRNQMYGFLHPEHPEGSQADRTRQLRKSLAPILTRHGLTGMDIDVDSRPALRAGGLRYTAITSKSPAGDRALKQLVDILVARDVKMLTPSESRKRIQQFIPPQ